MTNKFIVVIGSDDKISTIINRDHVVSVRPEGEGIRVYFTHGGFNDLTTPIGEFLANLRRDE